MSINLKTRDATSAAIIADIAERLPFTPDGTGAVATTVFDKLAQVVSVADFGVTADGTTDDTAALQAAADSAKARGAFLVGIPGTCKITGTVTINCAGDLSMMNVSANGTTVSPVFKLGLTSGSSAAAQFRYDLKLPKVTNSAKTAPGWTGFDTSVGIEVGNLYECRLYVPLVYGFGVGLSVGGYTAGFVYNEVTLGALTANKINLRVCPHAATGWANENNFYGGRFAQFANEGNTVSGCKQIFISNPTGSAIGAPNNNVFFRPSLEGDPPEYHIDLEGSFNTFINPRCEVPTGQFRVRFYSQATNDTNSNLFISGYKLDAVTFTFDGATSPYNKWIGSRANNAEEVTGCGTSYVNVSSTGETAPHIQGFPTTHRALSKTQADTDWTYRLYADGISFKATTNGFTRASLTGTGRLNLGPGNVAADAALSGVVGGFRMLGIFEPFTDITYNLGTSTRRWTNVYGQNLRPGAGTVLITAGSGTPEGAVTGAVGSLYLRNDGGVGTCMYVKESGAGNTGWVAK